MHALIVAGADVHAKDCEGFEPHQLATDDKCSLVFQQFACVVGVLETDPEAFISAVAAHCAGKDSNHDHEASNAVPFRANPAFPLRSTL